MSNANGQSKNPIQHCVTTAYWTRDQNFRKYFQMRKRHGIEPSVNVNSYYNKDKAAKAIENEMALHEAVEHAYDLTRKDE